MKIRVDQSVCSGHTMCNFYAAAVYPLDVNGYTALDGEYDIPPEHEETARRGAAACPERVITIIED